MEVKEFEGKNEEEAINKAIEALGLNREDIDVEIVETKKAGFLFGSGKVKIRVHMDEQRGEESLAPESDFEQYIVSYIEELIQKIGISARIHIAYREERKLVLDVETDDSGIIIGKRGQTLEALQLITNIVAGRRKDSNTRVIVDTQNYRVRREQNLIRIAEQAAEQVRRTQRSRLLEAMNPFERRLVHTALSNSGDVDTQSEGEGLYKRIRVVYRGNSHY